MKLRYSFYLLYILVAASCTTRKDVVYFQDIDAVALHQIDSVFTSPVIQSNDILDIQISALDKASVSPFVFVSNSEQSLGYLVNSEGTIQFPVLGTLQVKGMKTQDLASVLQDSLSNYIVDPVIQVRIINFKVTVLGAVNQPGTYQIEEESITLLQAIGLAGDIEINGKINNVLIIREVDGVRSTIRVDFTTSDWLNNPAYFVRQNDVIYVEPNFARVKSAGLISDVNDLLRFITTLIPTVILLTQM